MHISKAHTWVWEESGLLLYAICLIILCSEIKIRISNIYEILNMHKTFDLGHWGNIKKIKVFSLSLESIYLVGESCQKYMSYSIAQESESCQIIKGKY